MEMMEEHRIEKQSSIEKEPRTLHIHQVEFAREAALYVVNTRSIEEALRIFTEGLEPVARCAEMDGGDHGCGNDETTTARSPAGLRDVASAPF